MIPAEALLSLDHLWEGRFKDKLKIHRKFMLCVQVNGKKLRDRPKADQKIVMVHLLHYEAVPAWDTSKKAV